MVDADGNFLQIFIKPVQDRPTFFLKLFNKWVQKVLERVTVKPLLSR